MLNVVITPVTASEGVNAPDNKSLYKVSALYLLPCSSSKAPQIVLVLSDCELNTSFPFRQAFQILYYLVY